MRILKKRLVKLNEKNKEILEILKSALDRLLQNNTNLAAQDETVRKGLSSKIAFYVEKITDINLGAQETTLLSLEVNLDAPAKILLENYIDFLTSILLRYDELTSKDMESDELEKPSAVVREILIRLFTVALSSDADKLRDSEKIVEVLRQFIKAIIQKNILWEGTFSESPTEFSKELSTNHAEWLDMLTQMIKAIKLLHTNQSAIYEIKDYLEKTKLTIMQFLAVELGARGKEYELSDNQIRITLAGLESKILARQKIQPPSHAVQEADINPTLINFIVSESQLSVINSISGNTSSISSKNMKKKQMVRDLYRILRKTELLDYIVGKLEILNTATGWIFIISGVLKIDNLSSHIISHSEEFTKLLKIKSNSDIFSNDTLLAELNRQDVLTTANSLTDMANKAVESLGELKKPIILEKIVALIRGTLNELVELEPLLGEGLTLIDQTRLNGVVKARELPDKKAISQQAVVLQIKLQEEIEQKKDLELENARLLSENERLYKESELDKEQSGRSQIATEFLHAALMNGFATKEMLAMLQVQGANLNAFCNQPNAWRGYTALHIAANTFNQSACEWLLDNGVDVNIRDLNRQETALAKASSAHRAAHDEASRARHLQIVNYLKSKGGHDKPLASKTEGKEKGEAGFQGAFAKRSLDESNVQRTNSSVAPK